MNITPSQSTLQAFGNSLSQTAPTAQSKVPTATQTVAPPAANATQRADAAPRAEAPVRPNQTASPDAKGELRPSTSGGEGQRAAKIDILV